MSVNEETKRAIEEIEENKNLKKYESIEELIEDLDLEE